MHVITTCALVSFPWSSCAWEKLGKKRLHISATQGTSRQIAALEKEKKEKETVTFTYEF